MVKLGTRRLQMPKYLVETIDMFRMRYVIECASAEHAKDVVTMKEAEEFSQLHLDETIGYARVIDDAEYLRLFDEDNEYLKSWTDEQKFRMIHKVDYNGTE
jgi:hypothetical protein